MRNFVYSVEHRISVVFSIMKVLVDSLQDTRREFRHLLPRSWRLDALRRSPDKPAAFEHTIQSHTGAIDSTVTYFQERIADYFQDADQLAARLGLCLREALTNAIVHGNLEIPAELRDTCWEEFETVLHERQNHSPLARRQVTIRCEMQPHSVRFEVEDQGDGFDTETVAAQLRRRMAAEEDSLNFDALSTGGRGLMIIATCMDHVSWNAKGNRITMIKHLPSQP